MITLPTSTDADAAAADDVVPGVVGVVDVAGVLAGSRVPYSRFVENGAASAGVVGGSLVVGCGNVFASALAESGPITPDGTVGEGSVDGGADGGT